MLTGVDARLAAALSALQMGLFGLLVWVPSVLTGSVSAIQWGEFATTFALTAAGWVVADSYSGMRWLSAGQRWARIGFVRMPDPRLANPPQARLSTRTK